MKKNLKKFFSLVVSLVLTFSIAMPVMGSAFHDMPGHWAIEPVDAWSGYGVLSGYPDGNFRPDADITRGEMAQVISTLMRIPNTTTSNPFTDMNTGHWYYQAMMNSVNAGYIYGFGDGRVGGGENLTREQAMAMIARVLRIAPATSTVRAFTDTSNVSDWARGYVNGMINAGIVNGMTPTQIMPGIDINRGSVAQILRQAISTYAHQPGTFQATGTGITLVVSNGVTIAGAVDSLVVGDGVVGGNVMVNANSVQRLNVVAPNSTVTVNNSNVDDIVIEGNNARVVFNSTNVNAVTVNGTNVRIELNSGSTINSLNAVNDATGLVVVVSEDSTLNNVVDNTGAATIIYGEDPGATSIIYGEDPDAVPTPGPSPTPGPQDPAPTPRPVRPPSDFPDVTPTPTPAPPVVFTANISMIETTPGATGSLSHQFGSIAPNDAVALIYAQFYVVQREALQQAFMGDITARDRMYEGIAAFAAGAQPWDDFVTSYLNDVTEIQVGSTNSISEALRERQTFGQIGAGTWHLDHDVDQGDGTVRSYRVTIVVTQS